MVKEIILANPRGFCAGVERAINIVEEALKKYGKPLYVRHEIVHNKHVVQSMQSRGVIFVKEVDEVPSQARVIFSAHGVSLDVMQEAKKRDLKVINATCPLVEKVHRRMKMYESGERTIILIGHDNHPEVIGTRGQVQAEIHVVSSVAQVKELKIDVDQPIAYATQTTLSLTDTAHIIEAIEAKFSNVQGPSTDDICYATQNRQNAVRAMAATAEAIIVIGSKNSSNSNRLYDIAKSMTKAAFLIDDIDDLNIDCLANIAAVGITAGASAPEHLVQRVIQALQLRFADAVIKQIEVAKEEIVFPLPKELRAKPLA